MSLVFLRADVVRNVQTRLIQTYGGLPGLRDENALESAVHRPQHLHHYTDESRVPVLAASLPWALLRNHPFADGNKRIALASLVMSARLNGHQLRCTEAEETAMILQAASAAITEEAWLQWALKTVQPA